MKAISSGQLQGIRRFQLDAMDDKCHIVGVSLSSGTYGNTTETRTYLASGTACGIHFTNGTIVERGEVRFVDYDVVLRIVDTQSIPTTCEIVLIEKGQFQISGTFKPYSAPTVNSSIQHVNLKRQAP